MQFSAMTMNMFFPGSDDRDDDHRIIDMAVGQSIELAELGYHVWFTDHHFRGPWHSNPMQFAAYIAPQLPSDRFLGFGVLSTPLKDARAVPVSLVQDLKDHLEGLKKFERAERMEVLEKREMNFQGHAALFTKNRYYDPQERATWVEEVLFVNRDESLYRVELQCRAGEIKRFEPVFAYLLSTFQFDCR